jgi:hypothetical protein
VFIFIWECTRLLPNEIYSVSVKYIFDYRVKFLRYTRTCSLNGRGRREIFFFFRIHWVISVSFRFVSLFTYSVSFRFVSFLCLHILFPFVSQFTDFVSFRFVSLCFVSVSFLTLPFMLCHFSVFSLFYFLCFCFPGSIFCSVSHDWWFNI